MKLTKRVFSAVVVCVACVSMMTVNAFATPAGTSDYGKSDEKTVVSGETTTLTAGETGVMVDVPANVLPANVTTIALEAKVLDSSAEVVKDAVEAAKKEGFSNVVVVDLKLFDQDNNSISQLGGKIQVTIPVQNDANTVLYYNDETGAVENLGGVVKNGLITFETNHFSYYAMAKTEGSASEGGSNPASGDNSTATIVIVALMAIVAAGTVVITMRARKNKVN